MITEFQKFAQTFQGDPKKEVELLLASGQMTQNQLNQLQQFAHQFKSLMGMR